MCTCIFCGPLLLCLLAHLKSEFTSVASILEFEKATPRSRSRVTLRDFHLWGIADRETSLLFVKVDNEIRQ